MENHDCSLKKEKKIPYSIIGNNIQDTVIDNKIKWYNRLLCALISVKKEIGRSIDW